MKLLVTGIVIIVLKVISLNGFVFVVELGKLKEIEKSSIDNVYFVFQARRHNQIRKEKKLPVQYVLCVLCRTCAFINCNLL